MAEAKFSQQQIDRFNDKIKHCLEDAECRKIFERFLRISRKPVLFNAFRLWVAANCTDNFDDDMFLDLIDEVDGFNTDPLLTLSECQLKLDYTKREACRILEKIRPHFIEYLNSHHRL